VGIFSAQQNWLEIKNAAYTAIKLVLMVMSTCGILFLIFNHQFPKAFRAEPAIVDLAASLLIIAAMFQLFDGLQVTIIGVLRGLEDVRWPTAITLVGYWVIALPLAYLLAFNFHLQTIGIWIALLSSLMFVALCLLWRLNYLLKKNLKQAS
jgi:MATE family multidrug resistance protein